MDRSRITPAQLRYLGSSGRRETIFAPASHRVADSPCGSESTQLSIMIAEVVIHAFAIGRVFRNRFIKVIRDRRVIPTVQHAEVACKSKEVSIRISRVAFD